MFQQQEQQQSEEAWLPLVHHGVHSEEATDERRLLFANDEEQSSVSFLSQAAYLEAVCPVERVRERSVPASPSGVLSLSQLTAMPLPQKVKWFLLELWL